MTDATRQVTGILLAGGKSSRMGTDKALLPFGPQTMIEHIKSIVQETVEHILVVAGEKENYSTLNVPVFVDIYPRCGPLGGLHAGLTYSSTWLNLVLSCDLPLITSDFLSKLIALAKRERSDIVLPRTSDGRHHPLCTVYSKNCLPVAEAYLRTKQLKMESLYRDATLKRKEITTQDFPFEDIILTNINTKEDYYKIRK